MPLWFVLPCVCAFVVRPAVSVGFPIVKRIAERLSERSQIVRLCPVLCMRSEAVCIL